jgi:hypothetical protein
LQEKKQIFRKKFLWMFLTCRLCFETITGSAELGEVKAFVPLASLRPDLDAGDNVFLLTVGGL